MGQHPFCSSHPSSAALWLTFTLFLSGTDQGLPILGGVSSVKRTGCRLQFYIGLGQFAAPDNALFFGRLGAAWSGWRVHEEHGYQQNIRT